MKRFDLMMFFLSFVFLAVSVSAYDDSCIKDSDCKLEIPSELEKCKVCDAYDCKTYSSSDDIVVAVNKDWKPECPYVNKSEMVCIACVGSIQGQHKVQCIDSKCVKTLNEVVVETSNKSLPGEGKTKILPETASEIARERLGELGFNITLKEVGKGDETRQVYEAEGEKEGRMLGLFKIKGKIVVEINAETGGITKIKKPWWAFLASGI